MKNKVRRLAILIAFSLISIIGLQVYYAIETFQQKSAVFQAEVDQAFERAVEQTNEARLRRINTYFRQDISDTSLVKLNYEVSEDGPRLVVIDPKTGYKHLSMDMEQLADSLNNASQFIELAVEKNWKLLSNENILYWTDEIGNRLKAYTDSISISTELLEKNMKAALLKFNIKEAFSFVKSDSSITYDPEDQSFEIKMLPVKLDGETLIGVHIKNPEIAVLKRSLGVFTLTLFALVLLFISFISLYRILKKQRRLSRLKDDFIDNVTHELITPTTTLQLAIDTLGKSDPQASTNYISMAKQQANRIEAIVDQVLKTSLSELDKDEAKVKKCDLTAMVNEVVSYYQTTYGDRVLLETDIQESLFVFLPAENLATVLHNVISNAIKYGAKEMPMVKISLEIDRKDVFIHVKDNGKGIPKEHQPHIFDKFHRVPSDTHDVKGLGIGLFHAQRLMHRMGGELILRKSTTQGSWFSIHLKNLQFDEA